MLLKVICNLLGLRRWNPGVRVQPYKWLCLTTHCPSDQRNEELPTLLHFAAKYGLKKLTTTLLHCPGALQACSVMNKYGDYPNTLAEKSGFSALRQYIDEFVVSAKLFLQFSVFSWASQTFQSHPPVCCVQMHVGDSSHAPVPPRGLRQHRGESRCVWADDNDLSRHHEEVLGLLRGHIRVDVWDQPWSCRGPL